MACNSEILRTCKIYLPWDFIAVKSQMKVVSSDQAQGAGVTISPISASHWVRASGHVEALPKPSLIPIPCVACG
jgi:hypothetical protein